MLVTICFSQERSKERQYSTVEYSTVKCSAVQYSTVQYSKVQYSTIQYSATDGQTDGRTDITKLIVAFPDFSIAPINEGYKHWTASSQQNTVALLAT